MTEVKIDIKNLDLFKNLVSLLEKHFDDLPKELQESLEEVSKNGVNDFTSDDFYEMFGIPNPELTETSFRTMNIISINKILKKVVFVENLEKLTEYPETFYLKYDGKTIIEW